jgi:chitin disaccharide deacetylase
MQPKRVIINGDDFGASPEVNLAVVRAFHKGTLTRCSLMVTGEAFDQAVALARENPALSVGIHLVTVQGKAVLAPARIPHLVDYQGCFPESPVLAGLRYYFSPSARTELRQELAAQMEKFCRTGIQPGHIDSHLHMHVHPVIFEITCELSERFGVPCMRVPHDDFLLALRYDPWQALSKIPDAFIFRILCRRMAKELQQRRISFSRRVYGNFFSGRMSLVYALLVLDHLKANGSNELYFHPSFDQNPRDPNRPHSLPNGELAVLLDQSFAARLNQADLAPTTTCDGPANEAI